MNIWFSDEGRLLTLPDDAALEIARVLIAADDEPGVDAGNAAFIGVGLQAAIETSAAELGIDSGNRMTFAWGLDRWAQDGRELGQWAVELGRELGCVFARDC